MRKQAKWLVIDTSTGTMAGAIVDGERLLASVQTESERNHSIHIMTNIEAMLASSGLKIHDLDGIATGIGPGSYTGVRIAVTAAKTLSWTCSKPLVGISSLAGLALSGVLAEASERGAQGYQLQQVVNAIVGRQAEQGAEQGEAGQVQAEHVAEQGEAGQVQAEQGAEQGEAGQVQAVHGAEQGEAGQVVQAEHVAEQGEAGQLQVQQAGLLVLPLMDARRGQVYTAAFELGGTQQTDSFCRRVHHDHIVLMEQWCQHWSDQLAELKARGITTIALFGDITGHESSIDNLQQAAVQYGIIVIAAPHLMNGEALALLARGEWLEENVQPEAQHDLVPNYAQLTEAEVKQNEKERGAGRA